MMMMMMESTAFETVWSSAMFTLIDVFSKENGKMIS
jgi:hypothetical protein